MLGFSWSELMVVIVVIVLAVGPKQIPEVLYGLGRLFRRLQYMRYALTRQFDDFMDQSDLNDLRQQARAMKTDLNRDLSLTETLADEDDDLMAPLPPRKEQGDKTP